MPGTTSPLSRLDQFDPRKVPVLGQDGHLPAVQPGRLQTEFLRQRFAHPMPWQPEVIGMPPKTNRHTRLAAVLVGIVTHPAPTILLTRRSEHLSTHAGQIAFPGGKFDTGDISLITTALREAHEEIGLLPNHIDILGTLNDYTTGDTLIVTPVVALVRPGHAILPNPNEVDAVFEVPLAYLMNPAHHRRHALQAGGLRREWFSMPYQDPNQDPCQEHFIWGVTAGILRNLYRFLSA